MDFYDDYYNIVRFYIFNRLCYFYNGVDFLRDTGAIIFAESVTPENKSTHFDPMIYSDSRASVLLPLNEQGLDYKGGGWNFFNHNCKIDDDLKSGNAVISPSFMSHPFIVNNVTSGTFLYVTYLMDTTSFYTYQKNGEIYVPGMYKGQTDSKPGAYILNTKLSANNKP